MRRLLLVFALVLAACGAAGDGDTTTQPPPTTAPATAPATTAPATTTPPTTATAPPSTLPSEVEGVVEIEVTVTAGTVQGGGRVEVPLNERVRLTVVADMSDEVHVHGYDLLAEVAPGAPAVIEFVADIPGIFEVELERGRLLLLDLEVAP